jgi:hypothetical protein
MSAHFVILVVAGLLLVARQVGKDRPNAEERARRTLARRPRTRVGEASESLLRVTGRVRLRGEPMTAPLSGRPCVAFKVSVVQRRGRMWFPVLNLRKAHPFAVADESGEARIDTSGPYKLLLVPELEGQTDWRDRTDAETLKALGDLLESRKIATKNWYGGWKRTRYEESILAEGDKVTVGGMGFHEPSAEGTRANLREPPQRLVLRGTPGHPLLIDDC